MSKALIPHLGVLILWRGWQLCAFLYFTSAAISFSSFFAADECWWRGRQWQTGVALVVGGREQHPGLSCPPRHLLDSQTPIRECGPAWGSMFIKRSRPVLLWPNTNPWNVEHLVGLCKLLLKFLSISISRLRHTDSESIIIILKRSNASWNIETEKFQCCARSSLSYSYVCFRCSQDPPRHTSSGYLCNAFHQEDLRQDGAKKDFQPAPVRCKMDLWPKFLHWFLPLKNSQDSDTCAPVQVEANMQNRNVSKQTHIRLLRRFPPVCYFVTDFRWTTQATN